MAILTDPNPATNPGMELKCNNCEKMLDAKGNPAPRHTVWTWHTPYGTYVGGPEELDATNPDQINIRHPHCPVCGSHSVRIIKTL